MQGRNRNAHVFAQPITFFHRPVYRRIGPENELQTEYSELAKFVQKEILVQLALTRRQASAKCYRQEKTVVIVVNDPGVSLVKVRRFAKAFSEGSVLVRAAQEVDSAHAEKFLSEVRCAIPRMRWANTSRQLSNGSRLYRGTEGFCIRRNLVQFPHVDTARVFAGDPGAIHILALQAARICAYTNLDVHELDELEDELTPDWLRAETLSLGRS